MLWLFFIVLSILTGSPLAALLVFALWFCYYCVKKEIDSNVTDLMSDLEFDDEDEF